jgi:hypothetical protein
MTISRCILPRMRKFRIKFVDKIKIKVHILYSVTLFFRKSCRLRQYVKKISGARRATKDVTIWRIRVACRISKTTRARTRTHTHTHRNKQYFLLFHSNNSYANAPQYYVIHTLSVLCRHTNAL